MWRTNNVLAIVAGVVKTNNTIFPEKRGDGWCARIETHIEEVKALGIVNMDVTCQGALLVGVLPEPKVTAAMTKNADLKVAVDFSREWKTLTGTELVQGCIIARKTFVAEHPIAVQNFLTAYEASVNTLNSDPDAGAAAVVAAGIAANEALVKNALPRCNITYLVGEEMKSGLTEFWGALFAQVPTSIGGAMPDDGIFG